jgi:glycosyltransferase involved in cell wall biosynthesis
MQKILSLVWFKIYPPHFGGQKGIALFNRELSRYFEVDCLCSENNEVVADAGCRILPELPSAKSQFINPLAWLKIKKIAAKKDYAYLILEFPYYGFVGKWLKNPHRKLIIHSHNIETERFRSFRKPGWNFLRRFEKWSLRQADISIFKTVGDRDFAVKEYGLLPSKTYVLPYGIEKAEISKADARKMLEKSYGISPSEKILVFAGTLDYQPNTIAVRKIIGEIIPRLKKLIPEFRIIICGRNNGKALLSHEQSDDHLVFAGFVENIDPYLAGADAFINTVENVHGIQTKILDAIAAETNVVCFEKAAFAIDPVVRNVKLFAVADKDYDSFAEMVVKAVNLNFATPREFFEKYSWQEGVKGFVSYLEKVR